MTRRTLPETLKHAQAAVERANPDLSIEEIVADCGYHSVQTLGDLDRQGYMTCIPERRSRGRRRWKRLAHEVGTEEACRLQRAFYENRRRLKSPLGKRLLGRPGQTIERSFAHVCETGGLRRLHLRGRQNISKRYQLYVGATNFGILLRRLIGTGTPRGLQGRNGVLCALLPALLSMLRLSLTLLRRHSRFSAPLANRARMSSHLRGSARSTNIHVYPRAVRRTTSTSSGGIS